MPKSPGEKDRTLDAPTVIGAARVQPGARQTAKPSVLQQIGGPGAPRDHRLDLDEMIVGRSVQVHISIDSGLISRRHIMLRRSGPEYACEDLDSSNGMYLNGVKVHSATLREGDTLQIGDVVFVFREGR
ncbi:MAG TPA: FHA domain-containing protein [Polyangiaceae bacterium]|nr:FHA domain-containing protein [Polyangiaceae bacterium]